MSGKIEFSIIIPVYNEEENLQELYRRLTHVMEKLGSYEVIFIDDGSSDKSWSMIKDLHKMDNRIKGISFSRNFGHHIAISAGLDYSNGESVIIMDADLQDSPEEIPVLYEKYKEGYDLVYGIRKQRHDPIWKKASSAIFWWILRRLSGVPIPSGQTMLRIMNRRLVNVLKEMRERSRFLHGMMAWAGFNVAFITVEHHSRARGKSKYSLPKLLRLAFNAVASFSIKPLQVATYLGFLSASLSFIIGIYFLYKKIFYGIPVLGYASIIVSIFFVGGVQLLVLGIIGEYLGRVYQEVQKRPLYIIKESII